ncbi:MAG: hypothetical protein U9N31_06120 [Candidatus Marinimicrobia bacterium]|nr:hypothetical protein [Candidatus Neomarinimicrobiota bacterium]
MTERKDDRQLSMFPEVPGTGSIPSISTMPAFEKALGNLIKMSDLGAFIQLNIQGLEKSFSLNLKDYAIPDDFIQLPQNYSPIIVHLFPQLLRNRIKKEVYDIKAFFNRGNSFKTSFGYFLFRSHFNEWKEFIQSHRQTLVEYLSEKLVKGKYGQYYIAMLTEGYKLIQTVGDITAPWEFRRHLLLKDIEAERKSLVETGTTIQSLKPTEIDYPFQLMVLKTGHIPMVLHQFLHQIQILSVFKSIHLEYLSDREINTIEDIRRLVEGF